jgi:Outer membrane protein beta-barrel domain
MKKIIYTAVAVFGLAFVNAQSHQQGNMQIDVMGGFMTGSATSQDDASGSTKYKYGATGVGFGLQFQYGLAESFSAGIGLETGTAVLTPKNAADFDYGYGTVNPTMSTFKINLSGRYYMVNKDKLNVYVGPSIGYTTGKDKTSIVGFDTTGSSEKYAGLNFGVNVGGNYFFSDHVGVILQLGYEANGLKSTTTYSDGSANDTGKTGVALKF